jgi:hypothetical protein
MLLSFISLFFISIFFYIIGKFSFYYLSKLCFKTKYFQENLISENILVGIILFSFSALFANFFFPIKYLVIFFLFFLIYIIFKRKIICLKDLKIIIIFCIIFLLLPLTMKFGYDSGLYHLPHQLILREDKISFGLLNLHQRYGLISILNYLKSPFWLEDNLFLLGTISALFYIIFFMYCYEKAVRDLNRSYIYFFTLLFFIFTSKYSRPTIALVDDLYAIIFFLTIFKSFELLNYNEIKKKSNSSFKLNFFLYIFSILI